MLGGGLTPRPGRFTPTAGCVGPRVEPRTVQPVARDYTHYAISTVVMVGGGEETPKMPKLEEVWEKTVDISRNSGM